MLGGLGSITVSEYQKTCEDLALCRGKQRGSQFDYSDPALQIMLTIKECFIDQSGNGRVCSFDL